MPRKSLRELYRDVLMLRAEVAAAELEKLAARSA